MVVVMVEVVIIVKETFGGGERGDGFCSVNGRVAAAAVAVVVIILPEGKVYLVTHSDSHK